MIAETAAVVSIASQIVKAAQVMLGHKVDEQVKRELSGIIDSVLSLKFETLALQEGYAAIQNERDELRKQLEDRRQKLMRLTRYERKQVAPGVFVRSLKESAEKDTEPEHWLCDNCYTEERESTLQRDLAMDNGIYYRCHKPDCKALFCIEPPEASMPVVGGGRSFFK